MLVYCTECRFWAPNEFTPEFGQCRRYAPSPLRSVGDTFIGAYNNRAIWMYTRINDWCGDGENGKRQLVPETSRDQTQRFETKGEISAFEAAVEKARKKIG